MDTLSIPFRTETGNLSTFLSAFVSYLFFMDTSVLIFLKLYTEIGDEKIKYTKLNRIGMCDKEFKSVIYKELGLIFFTPLFFGSIVAYAYLFTFFNLAYFLFQLVYYLIMRKRYVNAIILDLTESYD